MNQHAPSTKLSVVFVIASLALSCTALAFILTRPQGLTPAEVDERINRAMQDSTLKNSLNKTPAPADKPEHTAASSTLTSKAWQPPTEKVKKLLQEVLETQIKARDAAQVSYERGLKDSNAVLQAQKAILETHLELCATKEERLKVYAEMLSVLGKFEELIRAREQAGMVTKLDVMQAKNERLLIAIKMEHEKE